MTDFPTTLAIDFGTKRIGLAVSRASLAEPLCIVENTAEVTQELKRIVKEERVAQLLVGVSEGAMAEQSKAFGQKLSDDLGLPVEFFDETLSSHQVHEQQRVLGKSGPIRTHIDHFAAATFLQEWLDTQ